MQVIEVSIKIWSTFMFDEYNIQLCVLLGKHNIYIGTRWLGSPCLILRDRRFPTSEKQAENPWSQGMKWKYFILVLQSISLQGWEWICLSLQWQIHSRPSSQWQTHSPSLGKREGDTLGGTEHLFPLPLWSLIKLTVVYKNGWKSSIISHNWHRPVLSVVSK